MIRFLVWVFFLALSLLPLQETNAQDMHKYLALGDSYTIGEAVDTLDRWPVQLVQLLREEGVKIADPEIIATTGWTTDELQAAIDKENPAKDYSLVSLLIGVNNQYRGYSVETYKKEFEALLQQAIGFAGGNAARVVVVSIPDYGVTPFAAEKDPAKIARELNEYNQISHDITSKYGVAWFNITPESRKAKEDPTLVAMDGLHPSGKMYTHWAGTVFPYVLKRLKTH